eukprot:jgi/Psemu1/32086/gm1.32086_g
MKVKIKSVLEWKKILNAKCTIELLKVLRKICYQASCTKVHAPTNLTCVMQKLYCTQQCDLDLYIELGYNAKTPINQAVKGRFITTLIIEDSNEEEHSRGHLGHAHPLQKTKKITTQTDKMDDKSQNWSPRGPYQQELATFFNKGKSTDISKLLQFVCQLLMNTVKQGESFGGDCNFKHRFVQFGVERTPTGTILVTHGSQGIMGDIPWVNLQDSSNPSVGLVASTPDSSSNASSNNASNDFSISSSDSQSPPLVHS